MAAEITVLRTTNMQTCREVLLVLAAADIGSRLEEAGGEISIYVDVDDFVTARNEIQEFARENEVQLPVSIETITAQPAWVAIWAFALAIWFVAAIAESQGAPLYSAGRVDGAAIRAGDWYRLVTALFLHGDLQHIVSNTGFGVAVLYFSARSLGSGLALLSALAAGVAGNAINVALQMDTHLSVGASTAIFGVLGMLGVFGWLARVQPQHKLASRVGPIVAAVAILAYTGAGGERTDVGAHLWGFAAGVLLGGPLWRLRRSCCNRTTQLAMGITTALVVALCWHSALAQ